MRSAIYGIYISTFNSRNFRTNKALLTSLSRRSSTVMEMTFDVLSRLLTYNFVVSPERASAGSRSGNDSIALLIREAYNSSVESGNEISKLAIEVSILRRGVTKRARVGVFVLADSALRSPLPRRSLAKASSVLPTSRLWRSTTLSCRF